MSFVRRFHLLRFASKKTGRTPFPCAAFSPGKIRLGFADRAAEKDKPRMGEWLFPGAPKIVYFPEDLWKKKNF